jgi:hypothetical protein
MLDVELKSRNPFEDDTPHIERFVKLSFEHIPRPDLVTVKVLPRRSLLSQLTYSQKLTVFNLYRYAGCNSVALSRFNIGFLSARIIVLGNSCFFLWR